MAEAQPLFAQDLCYSAQEVRRGWASLICEQGVDSFDSLRVTESSPLAMSVTVSGGGGWVNNDQGSSEGLYYIFEISDKTLDISANSSGSTRNDLIVAQVCDSQYAATSSGFTLTVIEGTPGAGNPALPSDGCTYYTLAVVSVPNGATSITGAPDAFEATDGNITDKRQLFSVCGQNDHDWELLVAASGWTANTGDLAPQVKRVGNTVYWKGGLFGGSSGSTATTVPSWAWPINEVRVPIIDTTLAASRVRIRPDGLVQPSPDIDGEAQFYYVVD